MIWIAPPGILATAFLPKNMSPTLRKGTLYSSLKERGPNQIIMQAPTVLLVASSIRMSEPVILLRR